MEQQIKDLTDLELAMHLEQKRMQLELIAQSIAGLQQELNKRLQLVYEAKKKNENALVST